MIQAAKCEFRDDIFGDDNDVARLRMRGLSWTDALNRSLQILRQSTASHVAPTLELMKMYRIAHECSVEPAGQRYIAQEAKKLLACAMSSINSESDRDDINESASWIPD